MGGPYNTALTGFSLSNIWVYPLTLEWTKASIRVCQDSGQRGKEKKKD